MSLFSSPEEHAANPPSTWEVKKAAPRRWDLLARDGVVLESHTTRRDAVDARVGGFSARLYEKESRWYAGEPVDGWIPYAQLRPVGSQ